MKNKLLLLLSLLILSLSSNSYAAFLVKREATVSTSPVATTSESNTAVHHKRSKISNIAYRITHPLQNLVPRRGHGDTNGILSLIFGIAGILGIGFGGTLLSIAAIVLGAIGLRNNERFALAGLILGIAGVLLLIIAAIFIVALISALL